MVRLDVHRYPSTFLSEIISIPCGAIRCERAPGMCIVAKIFQFLVVRLDVIWTFLYLSNRKKFQFLVVRLDDALNAPMSELNLFQFLVVRLDVIFPQSWMRGLPTFQFLVVRLDVLNAGNGNTYYHISIPCGAIRWVGEFADLDLLFLHFNSLWCD